jgi:peptidoglycan biosynthesis protein MviN/MurJ (putative lipid II flippase)
MFQTIIESLLRVADVPGTAILMLPLGVTVGSIIQCILGLIFLSRDFKLPLRGIGRLTFQSFVASVTGGGAAYAVLQLFGPVVNTKTFMGIFYQGAAGGIVGLAVTALVLWVLGSQELKEIIGALSRRFMGSDRVAVEPSDVA